MVGLIMLSGCQQTQSLGPITHEPAATEPQPIAPGAASTKAPEVANAPPAVPAAKPQVFSGSGVFVHQVPAAPGAGTEAEAQPGDITLNFVDTDVREVLPRVLGDVLHLNFTIDPKVQATVTIQTSRPLRQQDVLPALQEALRASGLTLVKTASGVYRLVSSDEAARTGSLPITVGQGRRRPARQDGPTTCRSCRSNTYRPRSCSTRSNPSCRKARCSRSMRRATC